MENSRQTVTERLRLSGVDGLRLSNIPMAKSCGFSSVFLPLKVIAFYPAVSKLASLLASRSGVLLGKHAAAGRSQLPKLPNRGLIAFPGFNDFIYGFTQNSG